MNQTRLKMIRRFLLARLVSGKKCLLAKTNQMFFSKRSRNLDHLGLTNFNFEFCPNSPKGLILSSDYLTTLSDHYSQLMFVGTVAYRRAH
jgi:hypothetical protein